MTVVVPAVTDLVSGDHCLGGIHSHVCRPTYVFAGGVGAKWTSGTGNRICASARFDNSAGFGGAAFPFARNTSVNP